MLRSASRRRDETRGRLSTFAAASASWVLPTPGFPRTSKGRLAPSAARMARALSGFKLVVLLRSIPLADQLDRFGAIDLGRWLDLRIGLWRTHAGYPFSSDLNRAFRQVMTKLSKSRVLLSGARPMKRRSGIPSSDRSVDWFLPILLSGGELHRTIAWSLLLESPRLIVPAEVFPHLAER